jgi:hypothetical protein
MITINMRNEDNPKLIKSSKKKKKIIRSLWDNKDQDRDLSLITMFL